MMLVWWLHHIGSSSGRCSTCVEDLGWFVWFWHQHSCLSAQLWGITSDALSKNTCDQDCSDLWVLAKHVSLHLGTSFVRLKAHRTSALSCFLWVGREVSNKHLECFGVHDDQHQNRKRLSKIWILSTLLEAQSRYQHKANSHFFDKFTHFVGRKVLRTPWLDRWLQKVWKQ